MAEFAHLSILGEPPPTELSPPPPCPISEIPDEMLVEILHHVAEVDLASLSKLSSVCKRLAFLISCEDKLWRNVVLSTRYGLAAMKYDFVTTVEWDPLDWDFSLPEEPAQLGTSFDCSQSNHQPDPALTLPLTPTYPTYRHMFKARPRIRFNGCYISTVNYTRPGAVGSNTLSWNAEILIVTYYRYLRFFSDGTLIALLTTTEPPDVVPYLQKDYMHYQHQGGNLPQAVMKDSLKGRWRLSGDPFGLKSQRDALQGLEDEAEAEGDIHIETEGVVSKYKYIMQLRFGSAGKVTKNNKLNWVGYWSHNKLTDDIAEFGLKNDRPYFWSRVKSWT